jgi:TetR/AcrR family transcriptional repressor of nem operon
MGRPRAFVEDEVLESALRLFWERGYPATSVQDLVDATGLSRASLYGAFGGKEQVFERALDRYRARFGEALQRLADGGSARQALGRFFDTWLANLCDAKGPRGCFLQLSITEGEATTPAATRMAEESMKATESALSSVLQRGKASGELFASLDERATARLLLVVLQGLSTAARAGRSRASLRKIVDQTLALLGPR